MGFFSWNCKRCDHPMLSHYAIDETNGWMNDAVIVGSDGSVGNGEYDGYGRVGEHDWESFARDHDWSTGEGAPDFYHLACWEAEGKPTDYRDGSAGSRDQGFFFDEGDHDLSEQDAREGNF